MLKDEASLCQYLPEWFREIGEFQQLCQAGTNLAETLLDDVQAVRADFFFLTMDAGTVAAWEHDLRIVANPSAESLDFRRRRLLNRVSLRPPYTLGLLYQKLDEIIGPGQWEVNLDYGNYTIYIKSSAVNQEYATELEHTINQLKGAHIVYINQPYLVEGIALDEQVSAANRTYYYKLGLWALGTDPFASDGEEEVILDMAVRTIAAPMLEDVATYISGIVASARVNGQTVITELTKSVDGSTLSVSYSYTPAEPGTVTLLELLDSSGTALTSAQVYVPVTSTTLFHHSIPVQEATQNGQQTN